MPARSGLFHPDFQPRPYWWQAYEPQTAEPGTGGLADVPLRTDVAIVGSGYAGLACALELARRGIAAVIVEAEAPGWGASTRNGGMVSSGASVGRRYSGRDDPERLARLRADAADGFALVERLIAEESIACEWTRSGGFVGAWCRSHLQALKARAEALNSDADAGAYVLPRHRQHEEIGSSYYHGGLVVPRAAILHPAKYYRGLLDACRRRGVVVCARAAARRLSQNGAGWRLDTARGPLEARRVVIATNGYTGPLTPDLMRRVIPVGSYIIATEELPEDLARGLMPRNRSVYDTRRVLTYYRLADNRRRLIFGGRARFGNFDPVATAPLLYRHMTDRFPQLDGVRITHAWTGTLAFTFDEVAHMGERDRLHFALGCNGSGVAMMTYLGTQVARRIAGAGATTAFDSPEFPGHWAYSGNPWFVPWFGRYLRARDWFDRRFR